MSRLIPTGRDICYFSYMEKQSDLVRIYFFFLLPFLFNDLILVNISSYTIWVLFDWALRVGVVIALVLLLMTGKVRLRSLGFDRIPWFRTSLATILAVTGSLIYFKFFSPKIEVLFSWSQLRSFPFDPTSPLFFPDLFFGLFLVALTEEIIARGIATHALATRFKHPLSIMLVSSLLFAVLHWSSGFGDMLGAFILGMVYMAARLFCGNIIPGVVGHYAYNFVLYTIKSYYAAEKTGQL